MCVFMHQPGLTSGNTHRALFPGSLRYLLQGVVLPLDLLLEQIVYAIELQCSQQAQLGTVPFQGCLQTSRLQHREIFSYTCSSRRRVVCSSWSPSVKATKDVERPGIALALEPYFICSLYPTMPCAFRPANKTKGTPWALEARFLAAAPARAPQTP